MKNKTESPWTCHENTEVKKAGNHSLENEKKKGNRKRKKRIKISYQPDPGTEKKNSIWIDWNH